MTVRVPVTGVRRNEGMVKKFRCDMKSFCARTRVLRRYPGNN